MWKSLSLESPIRVGHALVYVGPTICAGSLDHAQIVYSCFGRIKIDLKALFGAAAVVPFVRGLPESAVRKRSRSPQLLRLVPSPISMTLLSLCHRVPGHNSWLLESTLRTVIVQPEDLQAIIRIYSAKCTRIQSIVRSLGSLSNV
jgi:hypothetical protein